MSHKPLITDSRRHLVPAMYFWLAENYTKVYIAALVDHPKFAGPSGLPIQKALLPVQVLEDQHSTVGHFFNVVTLDFGINAIGNFHQDEEGFEVSMRFGGKPHVVYVPFEAVFAIYTPNDPNAQPFQFGLMPGQEKYSIVNAEASDGTTGEATSEAPVVNRTNHLRVVK